ncbi:hypothetical protein BDV98DRAFT_596106 [Pterulicium gracile]|uniref:Uncharacterized protein n=1 Tax=Pterulicium gracile TaxID=1884261 RepID=A0A5C3QD52_9AGAR|nr:hypothetical protein BDV98DRAFT_596106 [Pterula gracilis]
MSSIVDWKLSWAVRTSDKLSLRSKDSAVGSPYGTGNDTFGLSTGYKRWFSIFGDKDCQAGRRNLNRVASKTNDAPSWGYLFTDPHEDPSFGVAHGVEVSYLYSDWLRTGLAATLGVPKNLTGAFDLGEIMQSYRFPPVGL